MSRIHNLTKEEIEKYVDERPGIYYIYCYRGETPLHIGRLLKKDKEGILSIGTSKNLNKRLRQFIRGSITGRGHSSGNRYYYYHLDYTNKLGTYQLKFKFRYYNNRERHSQEARLLKKYGDKFGEVPPLNNQEALEK